jgi:hypothetical protein
MADMTKAYRLAALAVRQRFAEQHPGHLETLNRIRNGEVAAYAGSYDQVERVLGVLGVPVEMDRNSKRSRARMIFANCSGTCKRDLPRELARQVRDGAWLASSDWALRHIVEPAFPGMVRWTKGTTGMEVVSVEPYLDSLWNEVVVLGADPQWWLEGSSYPIEVLSPERVRVEAASHDLLARYGAPVVAVQFPWGQGNVFQVISHFWGKNTRVLTERHGGPCTDFLAAGMRLSEAGIAKVINEGRVQPGEVSFAAIQSAATATELVAQLCVRAMTAGG